jgi:predicted Zn-dependent protease
LWKRMKEFNKGKEPPQFLSTHPSSENRISQIRSWIPTIRKNFPKIDNI